MNTADGARFNQFQPAHQGIKASREITYRQGNCLDDLHAYAT